MITFPIFSFADGKNKKKLRLPKGWKDLTCSVVDAKAEMKAVLLTDTDLVVDVDPRNGGYKSLKILATRSGYDFNTHPVTVETASTPDRGLHFHFKKAADFAIRREVLEFPGIDFLTKGDWAILSGSYRADTRLYYRYTSLSLPIDRAPEAPIELLALIKDDAPPKATKPENNTTTIKRLSFKQIEKCLKAINVNKFRDYSTWLRMMFSVHSACSGDERGKQLFIAWSEADPMYAMDADCAVNARWDTIRQDAKIGVTTKSLLFYARRYGLNLLQEAAEKEVKKGKRPTIMQNKEYTEFVSDWVYVADLERFIHKRWGTMDTISSFNLRMRHAMKKATDVVLSEGIIDRTHGVTYLPRQGMYDYDDYNRKLLNVWRPPTLKPMECSEDSVNPFLEHCQYLLNNDEGDIRLLLSFMAANVQRATQRIRWCLVIHSDEEQIGKSSVLGRLMRECLGHHNVATPGISDLESDFNGYLAKKQLCIVEDLAPFNKAHMMAKLRTLITDDVVVINEKFTKVYTLPNLVSFLMFSNRKDALNITSADRRYCILSTSVKRKPDAYYLKLHNWLKEEDGYAKAYYFLLTYQIDEELMFGGHAPHTAAKDMIVEHVKSSVVERIEDAIDSETIVLKGYLYYTRLRDALPITISDYRLSRSLDFLGYRHKHRVKFNNKHYRIYSKRPTPPPHDILATLLG